MDASAIDRVNSGGFRVGEVFRLPSFSGGFRVWTVVGVFLGGENQEDVVELETVDRTKNTQGRLIVPVEILASTGLELIG